MKRTNSLRLGALAAAVGFVMGSAAWAAETAQQTFDYQVEENSQVAVSGNPANLTIVPADAGAAPAPVTDVTTTYSIVNNAGIDSKKITAAIDANTPTGVTLSVTLAAPAGGTSSGKQALSTVATDVAAGIDNVSEDSLGITYELSATEAAAGMASATTVVVTYTITNT